MVGLPKIILLNANGIYTYKRKDKIIQLCEMAWENNVVAIAVVESHLNAEVLSAEVGMRGYSLQRADRSEGVKKGGVALYIRNDVAPMFGEFEVGSMGNIEMIEYLLGYCPQWNLVLNIVYRPEETREFETVMDKVEGYIVKRSPPVPNILMVGDFNFRQIDWVTGLIQGANKSRVEKSAAQRFNGTMDTLCLNQLVEEPTRGPNILDLVLTNNPDMLYKCEVSDTGLSDHRMVTVSLILPQVSPALPPREKNRFSEFNFHSETINWESLS